MRFIPRTALVALVAALTVGALAAGSAAASAAECPGTGSGVALCSGKHALEGTFAFTGKYTSGTALKLEVPDFPYIYCDSTASTGQFVASKGRLEMSGTAIEWSQCEPSLDQGSCEVKPLSFTGSAATLLNTSEVMLPLAGKLIIKGRPGNTCELAGEYALKGEQKCKLPGSTLEALAHRRECLPTGSTMKFAGKAAHLEFTEEISLSPSKEFSLQHG